MPPSIRLEKLTLSQEIGAGVASVVGSLRGKPARVREKLTGRNVTELWPRRNEFSYRVVELDAPLIDEAQQQDAGEDLRETRNAKARPSGDRRCWFSKVSPHRENLHRLTVAAPSQRRTRRLRLRRESSECFGQRSGIRRLQSKSFH